MKTSIIISIKILVIFTLLTGILYPLLITVIAQLTFSDRANGSLLTGKDGLIGSKLIGQEFDSTAYFWSRPSATGYNPIPSGGSNLGPTSNILKDLVNNRIKTFLNSNEVDKSKIPNEMIFASASGLDPHIPPSAALLQVNRVAKTRQFSEVRKRELVNLINRLTEGPQYGIFGNKRINVLLLNLELDKMQ